MKVRIKTYRQNWHGFIRYIFVTGGGTAQLDLSYPGESFDDDVTAYFHALWVDMG